MIGIFGILVGIKCSHILDSKPPALTLASEGDETFTVPFENSLTAFYCLPREMILHHTLPKTLNKIFNVLSALFMVSHLLLRTATQKN